MYSCRNQFEHVICTFSFWMLTTDHILYVPDVIPSFVNYLPYLRQMLRLVYMMARFKLKITFLSVYCDSTAEWQTRQKQNYFSKKKKKYAKNNANGEYGRVYICAQKGASLGQTILRYIFFLSRSFHDALCLTHTVQCALKRYLFYFFSSSFCLLFRGFWWMQTERCIDTYGAQNARARDFRAILFMRF